MSLLRVSAAAVASSYRLSSASSRRRMSILMVLVFVVGVFLATITTTAATAASASATATDRRSAGGGELLEGLRSGIFTTDSSSSSSSSSRDNSDMNRNTNSASNINNDLQHKTTPPNSNHITSSNLHNIISNDLNNDNNNNHHHHLRRLNEGGGGSTDGGSSQFDLDQALEAAFKDLNLIHQRYEFSNVDRLMLPLVANNMDAEGWDILKYKVAIKTLKGKSKFLMIFGGSSVTAGHDNYYNQSYPFVVERRMKKAFAALGIELVVHNIAQGANNCRPSIYCYESMGGEDADFMGWEQSYNCGKAKDIFEMFARVAMYSNNALAYYSASGGMNTNECAPSTDPTPWSKEGWTPESVGIKDTYRPSHADVLHFRKELNKFFIDQGWSAGKFIGPLGHWYDNISPQGFSVWGSSNKCYDKYRNSTFTCSGYGARGPCLDKGGGHFWTREASIYGQASGTGRSWHPPAGMHLLRGELIAYNYLQSLIDAVYMIKANLSTGATKEDLLKSYNASLAKLQYRPFPEYTNELNRPFYCAEEECRYKPQCYTNYEPHYNAPFLIDAIMIGNHSGWDYTRKKMDGDPSLGYLDYRPCYESRGGNKEISFRLKIYRDHSLVIICGYNSKESLKHAHFYFHFNSTLLTELDKPGSTLDRKTVTVPAEGRVLHSHRKYHGDECTRLKEIPAGEHILTVSTDHSQANHLSSISHVITFK